MLPLNASALSPLAIGIPKGQGDTKKASSENPARGEIFRRGLELFLKKKAVVPDLSSFPDYVAAGFST